MPESVRERGKGLLPRVRAMGSTTATLRHIRTQGASWNQLYMHSALGSWGNPSSKWRYSESFGDLLHKASCEEDPGKADPGRRWEHGVNFLAESHQSQLGNLVETLTLMFDVLSRPLGTQSPNSKGLSVQFGCLKTLNYHDYPSLKNYLTM